MSTVTVSGRVDEAVKRIADMHIRKLGYTQAEVIAGVWRYIADTGSIPKGVLKVQSRNDSSPSLKSLRDKTPKCVALAAMSADDIKKELADRE